jgi:ankyrin repeat protein
VHAALQPASKDPRSRAIAELLVERMVSGGVPRQGASLRFALAVCARRSDLLTELLARTPDRDLTNAPLSTALELAIAQDQPKMVLALVDRLGLARTGRLCAPDGPVLYACSMGSTQTLRLLIDRSGARAIQARARDPQRHGATCLILALHAPPSRALPTLSLLLERGADPNIADERGRTPLHVAASIAPSVSRGHGAANDGDEAQLGAFAVHAMRALFDHGAVANVADDEGTTALMLTVERCWPDRVRLLLAHGADPDRCDGSGRAALDRLSNAPPAIAAEIRGLLLSGR